MLAAQNSLTVMSQKFRDARDGYNAEYQLYQQSRFRRLRAGVSPIGAGADWHIRIESRYLMGMEYVRDMHRNDPMIKRITRCAVQQQVQNGFHLDVQTDDEDLNQAYAADFHDWASDPDRIDLSGEMALPDIEQSAYEAMIVDGDHWIAGIDESGDGEDLKLQCFEGHLCRTPTRTKKNIALGVMMDQYRKRLSAFFLPPTIEPWKRTVNLADLTEIPFRDAADGGRQLFQVYHPERQSLTRGMTAYHPIVDVATMMDDTSFALLVKQQMAACFGIFFEQVQQGGAPFNPQTGPREVPPGGQRTLAEIINEAIAPGQKIALPAGVKASSFNPNMPTNEAMAHLKYLLQICGLNLGLPLVLVLLDARETNFSGWRGALDSARVGFRTNQKQFIRRFHRPLYLWRMRRRMRGSDKLAGQLRDHFQAKGPDVFKHRWNTPNWPYVMPLQDAQADAFQLQNLLSSPRRISANRGVDIKDIIKETVLDNASAIEQAMTAAATLNDKFPDSEIKITWRDILNRDMYRGATLKDTIDQTGALGDGQDAAPAGGADKPEEN
jgi:capsid protein